MQPNARSLWLRAEALWLSDDLAARAETAWSEGPAAWGAWMQSILNGRGLPTQTLSGPAVSQLLFRKYLLCGLSAVLILLRLKPYGTLCQWAGAALGFYVIEGSLALALPLALTGRAHPLWASVRWVAQSAGLLPAMLATMSLASRMLLGGFLGRGFVRSWYLGCAAVALWFADEWLAEQKGALQ